MVEYMDSMITEAPTKALQTFMGLVRGVCEVSIPRKTLCKCSKPYWSNERTHLSQKLKDFGDTITMWLKMQSFAKDNAVEKI